MYHSIPSVGACVGNRFLVMIVRVSIVLGHEKQVSYFVEL